MKFLKYSALILAIVLMFSSCKDKNSGSSATAENSTGTESIASESNPEGKPAFVEVGKNGSRTDDPVGFQFEKPKSGEEIVVISTEKGDIKLRLFSESAPIAVENFRLLIKSAAYDGSTFHRIIKDFMIQGGQTAAGTDAWGGSFRYEYNKNLRHFRGALSMAHSSLADSNSSQFYIVQNSKLDSSSKAALSGFDKDTSALYNEHGGSPWLDGEYNPTGGHTVFGQVFEGMDVVDAIAAVAVVDSNGTPAKEVAINSIILVEYNGK